MPNMSYCRFRNTLLALQDCYEHLHDDDDDADSDGLSREERIARDKLIKICIEIAQDEGYELPENS